MKILIIYDSLYGNTEKIARCIRDGFDGHEVLLHRVADTEPVDLPGADLLIVGSPTHGGRASRPTTELLNALAQGALKNCEAAAFDTGIPAGPKGFMRILIRFLGYASTHISALLAKKGAQVIAAETFFVSSKMGPLVQGERERATQWARTLIQKQMENGKQIFNRLSA